MAFYHSKHRLPFWSGGTVLVDCIKIRVEPHVWGALSPLPYAQPNYLNSVSSRFSRQNLWVVGTLTLSVEVWWGLSPFLLVTQQPGKDSCMKRTKLCICKDVQLKALQWKRDIQEIVSIEWYFREIQWSSEPECIRCSLHSQGKVIWSQSMPNQGRWRRQSKHWREAK